ncbi:hypothetical protein [Sagittula stellata]|uniref:hypothetical protein n=1 Tax=Sagittula stellata TaxID=52603 RepID=UPI00031E2BB9|nr:hypothetical protein [Sagittula stellata]
MERRLETPLADDGVRPYEIRTAHARAIPKLWPAGHAGNAAASARPMLACDSPHMVRIPGARAAGAPGGRQNAPIASQRARPEADPEPGLLTALLAET